MDCDVAVLGGGPGGYTAAIRAAQLGAKTVCIEKEPELGGTCLRIGCIPTKAWVQTAFAIKEAEETFGKLGVRVGEPQLDFATANEWKAQVVKQMTQGLVVLGGGIIGCEFASIFQRFGSEVTIIEMLPQLIPMEDDDASAELAKQFGRRGITLHLEKQCTKVEETGEGLRVHFGDGETIDADLMLVAVGRGPLVEGLGLEEIGVELDRRKGIAADEHRRTTVAHIYAVGD